MHGSSRGADTAPQQLIVYQRRKRRSSKGADGAPQHEVEEPTQSPPNNGMSQGKLVTCKSNKRKAPSTDENPKDAINLVQKHLQVETLCLPEMQTVRMVSTNASIGNIRPRRALSEIQNLSNGVVRSSDAKCSGTVSSKGSLSSITRPKTPHVQIAMLKKRLFYAKSSVDPFSSIFVDEVDAHSEDVNMSNNSCISGKVTSPITVADDNAPAEVGTSAATDDTVGLNINEEHSHDLTNTVGSFDIDQTVREVYVLGQEEAMIPSESATDLEGNVFQVGDNAFLKVFPIKGVTRFGLPGKLSPRYVGPFEILQKHGEAVYRVALPPMISGVHNVFDISMLRRYVHDKSHVVDYRQLELTRELSFEEVPVRILDRKDQVLRRRTIPYVKVQWEYHPIREATWEVEEDVKRKYPLLFENSGNNDEAEKVVRRSTRIRSRPLAFWEGERFLYGCVHQSMATVIGVKSFGTPGNDGKPSLKVKSFVDEKFKHLVEFAALH